MFPPLDFRMRTSKCQQFRDCQPWDELTTRFEKRLVLDANTYEPHRPFKVQPSLIRDGLKKEMPEGMAVISPKGGFRYTEVVLSKGEWLQTFQGGKKGHVCFDGDVVIPRLNATLGGHPDYGNQSPFNSQPWMSITPMEVFTQRAGLRRAKGHVVIAGLGLGWLFLRVAERKQVKKITVIEISEELIDWVLPKCHAVTLTGYNNGRHRTEIDVRCGDAREIVPTIEADVALVDIAMGYGGNEFPKCPSIGHVWVWGSQYAS